MQDPGAQHAAWIRELQCETVLMSVHDNLYKMEEYAVHASAEAYVGTVGESHQLSHCQQASYLRRNLPSNPCHWYLLANVTP